MDLIFWHIAKDEENYCLYNGSASRYSIYRLNLSFQLKYGVSQLGLLKYFNYIV